MKTQRPLLLAFSFAAACAFGTPALAAGPRKVTVDQERLAQLPAADQQRVLFIADRLQAITDVDRSALNTDERRALRTELKSLKAEADTYNRQGGTVIYFSGVGLILIIILLIILL